MLTKLRGCAALAAGFATLLLQAGPVAAQTPESAASSAQVTAIARAPAGSVAELFPAPPTAARKAEAGLPLDVLEAAAAYRLYMGRAAAQPTTFTDGSGIANSLREAAAYEPNHLARGAIAFAALAALQDETFKQSVRAFGADPAQRKQLIALLIASPSYSSALPGADTAAERAVAALAGEGARVRTVGERVKQAAYDVQRQDWSKLEVSDRVARLADVKSLSAVPLTGLASDVALLRQAATVTPTNPVLAEASSVLQVANATTSPTGAQPWPTLDGKALPTQVVSRALTIAALTVLGETDSGTIDPLLNDANCGSCLRMSKLNLFQCLAVAKPWYEDVFCLGQHVLIDTGDCIQAAAIGKGPAAARPLVPTAAPVAPTPAVTLVSAAAPLPSTPVKSEPAAPLASGAALR